MPISVAHDNYYLSPICQIWIVKALNRWKAEGKDQAKARGYGITFSFRRDKTYSLLLLGFIVEYSNQFLRGFIKK